MANYGEQTLSKLIQDGDMSVIARYGIEAEHFDTETEREAFRFICRYGRDNGQVPSYATLVAENPDITYIPDVSDQWTYLVRKLKEQAAAREIVSVFNQEVSDRYDKLGITEFIDWLTERATDIKLKTRTYVPVGVTVSDSSTTREFLSEYERRAAGESYRMWTSKFPGIVRAFGKYLSGNMYTWFGRSGRGKSIVTMEEAIESAFQGATVLVWSLEMSRYEWLARAITSISARASVATANVNGHEYMAGFSNRAMLSGQLSEDEYAALATFLGQINEVLPGKIILRANSDADFTDRSIRQLEADILETQADVVLIDPFYYMHYERNTSRTTGGDAAATSQRLRQLFGRTGVVGHVITQADESGASEDDEGNRELAPPKRDSVKKTKAVMEDAAGLFGIDTLNDEGRGVIVCGKGRSGGEDARVEIVYLPNYGIVREILINDASFFVDF